MLEKRIRELRTGRGWTQQELAARLGISASAVGMYEQGRRQPDTQTLRRMAQVFGVTVDALLEEETPRTLDGLMDSIRTRLRAESAIMFDGVPLSEEDLDAVPDAMRIGAQVALQRRLAAEKKQDADTPGD